MKLYGAICQDTAMAVVHIPATSVLTEAVIAINDMFGYQSKYGAFDEFIINPDDSVRLRKIADYLDGNKG